MNGSVRSSAGLVWRHQRLVWWIFVVNLVIAWLSSLPARATLSAVLDHSLESAKLVTGFDVSTLGMLLQRPDVSLRTLASGTAGAGLIFLIYLLLIDGGVFATYLEDRKLSRSEFFESSGLFFWRMVRLALYSAVPFALLIAADFGVARYAEKLSSDSPLERLGFFVNIGCKLVIAVVALFVRLWFDLAQARVVLDDERKLCGTLWGSLKLAFGSGRLFASYIGIGLFAAITFGVGVAIWVYFPHSSTGASFLLLELVTVIQIASRLWLKAASARRIALLPIEAEMPRITAREALLPALEVTDVPSAPPE
jgi:hypothetical protein